MNLQNQLFRISLAALVIFGMTLQGCIRDKCDLTYTYMEYTPVYMSYDDLRSSVSIEGPRSIERPGKIFANGNYLFVNEIAKGTHIIDNTDPANPVGIGFITAPGNYDMSVNCDHLYLDSSTDLLVFNVSNPAQPRFVERQENAFPHMIYFSGYQADPQKGVVVDWTSEMKEVPYDCQTECLRLW